MKSAKFLFAVLATVFITVGQACADRALVVGVNSYPGLNNADLRGCINDATAMKKTLEARGFQVELLPNGTRNQILEALRAQGEGIGANENFVFYFSGHGSGPGQPRILTHNSQHASTGNDIRPPELNQIVKGFKCKTKTIMLDSCFSGAMMKAIRPPDWQSRYYRRAPKANSRDLTLVDRADTSTAVSGNVDGVCYFVASRYNEEAIEATIEAERHGVFTHYLVRELGGAKSWGALQSKVSSKVVAFLNDRQHPMLTSRFRNVKVFGSGSAQPAQDQTLWQIFNTDSVDKKMLKMTMNPNQTRVRVGQRLSFKVQVGAPGYLVIAERGTSGRVNLIYPLDGKTASAKVAQNQVVAIPGGNQAWAPDAPGSERLRAFLFKSPNAAGELLGALSKNKGLDFQALSRDLGSRAANSKDLRIVGPATTSGPKYQFPYYTSDIHFLVVQ